MGGHEVNAHASVHVQRPTALAGSSKRRMPQALLLSLPAPLRQVACKRDAVLILLCRQVQVGLKGIQGVSKEGFIALVLKLISKPPATVSYELMVMNQDPELSTADGKWWQPCSHAPPLTVCQRLRSLRSPCFPACAVSNRRCPFLHPPPSPLLQAMIRPRSVTTGLAFPTSFGAPIFWRLAVGSSKTVPSG